MKPKSSKSHDRNQRRIAILASHEHALVSECAYNLWLSQGCPAGNAEANWLEAERRLRVEGAELRPRVAKNGELSRSQELVENPGHNSSLSRPSSHA